MTRALTALVLTPSLGGDFFGDILTGLARAVVGAGGRLVVVETLQAHAPRDEAGLPGMFGTQVAWSQVDGVVSITTAVGADYLDRLERAGKPVVLLSSTQLADVDVPVARPDNHRGTVAAVEHLIEHGHTRIGFVGNIAQRDVKDRLEAYTSTLTAHGLAADPALLFPTPDNGETGGASVAERLLASANRPTAVMAGTDRNAIGLMGAVAKAGLEVPRDLAVMSFDNIAAGAFGTPALSSVDPRFDEVGALAGRLILAKMRGDGTSHMTVTPDSTTLELRESCGCAADAHRTISLRDDPLDPTSPEGARAVLHHVLARELRTGSGAADRRSAEAISAIVDEAMVVLEAGDAATARQISTLASSLRNLTSRPSTLRRFTDAMSSAMHNPRLGDGDGRDASAPTRASIAAALWKAQAGAFLHQAELTEAAIAEQYVIDAGLLATGGADPRTLRWLTNTHVKAGALALWEGDPADRRLSIVGEYHRDDDAAALVGTSLMSDEFPPRTLIVEASAAGREVCVVMPVSTRDRDWGLLALVAEIDPTTARETYQHWTALLCAALESQRRQEEVRRSALFDALTGLPNRRLFVQRLEHALALRERSGTPFAVLFLDVDGFKLINDSLGHQMGDRVLKSVATDITGALRDVDTAARFGGDEFVILLPDTEPLDAEVAAKRVQAALATAHDFDGHKITTRVSIGIASTAVDYASAEDVLRDADTAMYRAKTTEPGTVAFFDEAMHDTAVRRASMARAVLLGLQENQFEVHYQPIVNLTTGRTDRFEALLRWRHPERGLLHPEEFLGAIEETADIIQVGHWVLNEVCRKLAAWGPGVDNVSINISDKEFWSQDLLAHVMSTLRRHKLDPHLITLEITEGVLMRRPEMALRIMHRLHEAGLRLHIDDFGTGYSSLETLHRFPVEAFKIDRSFIQSLTEGGNSAALISSLVQLGQALGLSVLAEGVETEEQLAFLQSLGCATGQGYLFMPAVTADRVAELLGRDLHAENSRITP
ncbi:EAL domain-containing protein [Demequina sp. TTPB684]|uniref:EAL domain-containing protein n=1 Tax=unclassified Demequina TaxID=2620311 RepID=UPI001CF57DC7|nr:MULTISPECIES: EAL domain-containing protein [unclassified Demequina]MCB2412646.1 EAL domain-containing protein [Demequina sp. TTPB684]UPU87931.1 EAL domain-containing protein [Demequina sp. TMPB413]